MGGRFLTHNNTIDICTATLAVRLRGRGVDFASIRVDSRAERVTSNRRMGKGINKYYIVRYGCPS